MSPRSATANQTVRDATRGRFEIAHALRLFGERGYASTPVSAIAAAAGVSQGLLYHYFPGKDRLDGPRSSRRSLTRRARFVG